MQPAPTAFDAFADTYDDAFSHTWLGQTLRRRVWQVLATLFPTESHLLELAGGTGIDAAWLAEKGHRVYYTDGSPAMIAQTQARLAAGGLAQRVTCHELSLQDIAAGGIEAPAQFDGVLSNFGGLNVIGDWQPLAAALATLVRPDGRLVLVPMGPTCPWEIAWFGARGAWQKAWRRRRQPAAAQIGDRVIPIWYPSHRQLMAAFSSWFELESCNSLGLWLPPSYLAAVVDKHNHLRQLLAWLDTSTSRWLRGWGDHYIAVLRRKRADET